MAIKTSLLVVLVFAFLVLVGSTSAQDESEETYEAPVVDRSGGWRLPFDGTIRSNQESHTIT